MGVSSPETAPSWPLEITMLLLQVFRLRLSENLKNIVDPAAFLSVTLTTEIARTRNISGGSPATDSVPLNHSSLLIEDFGLSCACARSGSSL